MKELPGIAGATLATLEPHVDDRGRFVEALRTSAYPERFVQVNHSRSIKGVLRGLHYHEHQADLWYVVSGRAQVALADLRTERDKPTVETLELCAEHPQALYIPPGVAHGYLALTDLDLIYLVTREYDPADEHGVAWDDPTLDVPWRTDQPTLSERDRTNPRLQWNQARA